MVVQSSSPQPAASPQLVGREFVRQYYTMMGEAPKHVYRFYSNESVYAFNGSDPVIGQQAVSERIESLNLKDCHTKIRVVDAHETLNRGVVVQVIGEISVNSGSLRRFSQTFVLALQTEKKYYVHNDTFRYLDELFDDNVLLHEDPVIQNDNEQTVINTGGRATLNGTAHPEEMVHVQQASQTIYASQQPLPPRNNSVARQEHTPEPSSNYIAPSEWSSQATEVGQQISDGPQQSYQQHGGGGDTDSSGFEERRPESKDSSTPSEDHDDVAQPETEMMEPTSWAGRVASGGKPVPVPREQSTAYANAKSNISPSPAVKSGPPVDNVYKGVAPSSSARNADVNNAHPPRASPAPSSSSATGGGFRGPVRYGGPGGRPTDIGDELQVFVGSLPEDVLEQELKDCFASCGTVTEVRLRTRGPQANIGRPHPSFAFVVLDAVDSVRKILEKREFAIRNGSHRITVEPKRPDDKSHRDDGRGPRERMDRDRQSGMSGPRGNRMGGGGPSRGFRGGGGLSRGGSGGGGGTRMFSRHAPSHYSNNFNPSGGGGGTATNPPPPPPQPKS